MQFANCRPLIVATTQLECPEAGRDTSHQRAEQLQEALQQLSNLAACVAASQESSGSPSAPSVSACCDVVLAGDLQWSDAKDGALKLLPGWADAWPDVRPTLQQQAPAPAPASGSSSSSASAASSTGTTFDARGNTLLASGVYRGAWTGPRPDR